MHGTLGRRPRPSSRNNAAASWNMQHLHLPISPSPVFQLRFRISWKPVTRSSEFLKSITTSIPYNYSGMASSLPRNVHVSTHPCLQTKLSQLREATTNARETKDLVHEVTLILACEAFATGLSTKKGPQVRFPIFRIIPRATPLPLPHIPILLQSPR